MIGRQNATEHTRQDTRDRCREYILSNFMSSGDERTLADDTSFLEEGIMDSTGVLDLVQFIEETFGIQIMDEELIPENLDSIDRLVYFVEGKARQ